MVSFDIFNRVEELIYITDMETDEIIFANTALIRFIGKDSLEDVTGKKCYKILCGNREHCDHCTNEFLEEGSFYEWTYRNELFNKRFFNQDTIVWVDGRKCRLEISKELDLSNEDIGAFYEKLGNEVLGIALKEEDIDIGIQKSIGLLGERMNAERIYIFEIENELYSNTYEWCAEGVTKEIDNLQNIPKEWMKPWEDQFQNYGEVMIRDLEEIRETNPIIYDILKPQNINTLVAQPIYIQNEFVGFLGVDNVHGRDIDRISSFMKMIGTYTAALVEKRNHRLYLEKMGQIDGLTELYNRKTGENRINHSLMQYDGTLVILDLDCFKQVNDLFGHQRGDQLLKEVAQKLKEVTRATDIVFRLGGDEFGIYYVALTDMKTIQDKCQELLKRLNIPIEKDGERVMVSASIGVARAPKDGNNFQKLYKNADKELYISKEQGKNRFNIGE